MTEQPPASPTRVPTSADGEFTPAELIPRRQPGEPHPYMLERNPPNLWMLVFMTVGSLVTAAVVLALTVLL
ncbi:MAG: hypothetical protein IT306_13485 [Chloroflexi bacterium]|nr:hypothetical protein [Chloroflexota bacterium]